VYCFVFPCLHALCLLALLGCLVYFVLQVVSVTLIMTDGLLCHAGSGAGVCVMQVGYGAVLGVI
jgi:hypothetical protein